MKTNKQTKQKIEIKQNKAKQQTKTKQSKAKQNKNRNKIQNKNKKDLKCVDYRKAENEEEEIYSWVESKLCRKHVPDMLFDFYEQRLKFASS